MKTRFIFSSIIWVVLCLCLSGLAGWVTQDNLYPWFDALAKPSFNPPAWVFGPVWTVLYILIGLAGARAWRLRDKAPRLLAIYLLQLLFNFGWSFIFFASHQILFALVDILLLWLSILITLVLAWRHDKVISLFFTPYLFWVTFAAVLNASLYVLN